VFVKSTAKFKTALVKLAKKDKKLFDELEELVNTLSSKSDVGTHIGDGVYKIRIKNNSNNKGKSAGYRVITFAKIEDTVLLVYIYSKSDTSNISTSYIDDLVKSYIKNQ